MPTTLPFSGARIPNQNEAGDPSADFARFGGDVDDKFVLKATSQSDRDTKYSNVSAGTVVTCALSSSTWIQWVKLTTPPTAAAWGVLAERQAIATSGILTAVANWSVTTQRAQKRNSTWWIRGGITYGGSTDIVAAAAGNSGPGNLANFQIGSIGSAYQPDTSVTGTGNLPFFWTTHATDGAGYISSTGEIWLTTASTSGVIASGAVVDFFLSYPGV